GDTMTYTPDSSLASSTTYTVNVGTGAMDLAGNSLQSLYSWQFTTASAPDTTSPIITIYSPQNTLYITTGVPLNVSANEVILTWLYSLNGAPNITFTPNTTITALEGTNNLIVYATDTAGNWNSSTVTFSVSLTGIINGIVTNASSGLGLSGAIVKLTLYPQYNATTLPDGNYTISNVPNGLYDIVAEAAGYTKNSSTVNVAGSPVVKDFSLAVGSITGDYRYYSLIDNEITANKVSSSSDVGKSFTIPQYGNGVSWNTDIYVTDVSGLGATLTLDYFRVDGTLAVTETPSVPAYGTYRLRSTDGTNGRPTIGKLVITSTNDMVGEFVISSTSNSDIISSKLYNAADYATSLSIPQYGDNTAWDTYIAISDVSGLGANLTLRFYRPDGTLAVTETKTVLPNGLYKELPISDGKNGRPKMGRLEIESDHLITGEYRIYSLGNGGILSNKLYKPSDKKTSFTVPQYGNHLTWDTYLAISDASGLGANLTIRYYYPNGTLAVTETRTVPANGLYKDIAISDGTNGRPTIGKLEIISDNIVFGELRIYSLSTRGIMSNSLYNQPDISSKVVVPYYGNNVGLGTKVNLADVSGLGLNVQVDYRNLNGALARTEYLTIPADGLEAYVVSDGSNGKPTEGNMFISMLP
ncbi:MAG: Ig-like domain-containing protein, partial [Candidatus Methanoperedens sp.]